MVIDLQMARYARTAVDLSYLLNSSLTPEFRKDHLDDLLKMYHSLVMEHLEKCGVDTKGLFSLDDLKRDYVDCGIFGFLLGSSHCQVLIRSMYKRTVNLNWTIFFQFALSDIVWDMENMTDMATMIMEYKKKKVVEARTNEPLRRRTIQLVREAEAFGVFEGL